MKIHFLGRSLDGDGHVSRNNSSGHLEAIRSCVETAELSIPFEVVNVVGGPVKKIRARWSLRSVGRRLAERMESELGTPGPHVLLHTVLSGWDLRLIEHLGSIWNAFDHRVVNVIENIRPDHPVAPVLSRYDFMTCFCDDLRMKLEAAIRRPSLHWPSHTNVLAFASLQPRRPVDILQVGRRDRARFDRLDAHCRTATAGRPFLLDFTTRPNPAFPDSGPVELERLMGAYARSKVAVCETAETTPRFEGRSPLTTRWVHGWAAGCTVVGTRPTGSGVAELIDWPESTLEWPDDPEMEIPFLESLLADEQGLRRRRHRNVAEALRRFDTRHRLASLLDALGIAKPDPLQAALDRLEVEARLAERQIMGSPA